MTILTIEQHGARYHIMDPGGLIAEPLRAGHPYETKVLEHIYRSRRSYRDGIVIDVGANVGNHTLWFACVCGFKVIAVEPLVPDELQRNIDLNRLDGTVHVWRFALGESDLRLGDAGRGQLRGEGPYVVKRLDDQLPLPWDLPVRLMKIDVEGMEAEVIAGAVTVIERDRPRIYAEAWDDAAHQAVAEILTPRNYEHTRTFGATPLEEWTPSQ